jgi:penicillin amidase
MMRSGAVIRRDKHGVPHLQTAAEDDLYFCQGQAHATDRGLQMLLMRIVGQGRISEVLDSSDDSLRADRFFRRANWAAHARPQIERLSTREREFIDAYCRGANLAFSRRVPWEFSLCRYRPEPWKPADTLLLFQMIGYLTLAQSQAESERLFVELVQAGVSEAKLRELFPGLLGGLDVELIRQVKLGERVVPADLWGVALPRMMASNNWVIAGHKAAGGKPLLANDVHLEGNRLPAVWYEMSLRCGDRYLIGGSVPGIPGILSGRNNDLAWGVTHAFVDGEDSWIERCREGKFYREDENRWIEFRRRVEVIKRKHKPAVEIEFFENDHGVLDGDPRIEGYYLATRWASAESGAGALQASLGMLHANSVDEGMQIVGRIETGWNCLLADRAGNIGYQMTGLAPKRREGISGFVPLPGWKKENDWQGFWSPEDLPRLRNPKEGFFATANEDLNQYGQVGPINMPMGPYRGDRIRDLLRPRNDFQVEDMCAMQFDVYSRQAEIFMRILKPLLPDTPKAEILKHWDLRYTAESEGACLFERFYEELYREVFGRGGGSLGEAAVNALRRDSGIFIDFYQNFDRVLLAQQSAWLEGRTREEVFGQAATRALEAPVGKWKEVNQFMMSNLFFNGKLPRWLGFDRGPYVAIGNRATIHQAQFYSNRGRRTSFLPSFRIVSDLAADAVLSNLAGGPSDRRFSKWYCSDVENWLEGKYKRIHPANQGGNSVERSESTLTVRSPAKPQPTGRRR